MILSSDNAVCAGAAAALKDAEPAMHASAEITRKKYVIDLRPIELVLKQHGFWPAWPACWLATHQR
jgi:hypothetical protein